MPTPKYRLVEVIIHEGESAYAGHYLSVNLETKEVFNDQFPNRKYMKYSEFSEYEAREKYGKLPMTLQVKDMMKKMIGRSSEDIEDRLIVIVWQYSKMIVRMQSFSNVRLTREKGAIQFQL